LTDKTVTIAAVQCADTSHTHLSIDNIIDICRCAAAKDTPVRIAARAEFGAVTTRMMARVTEPSSPRKKAVVQILPENGRHRLSMTQA
jgi:hypothetical protein